MLLAVDIGNSSIKFGVFDRDKLTTKFSIPTNREYTANDVAGELGARLPKAVDAAIVCSVVPEVEGAVADYVERSFQIKPRFVRSTDVFKLKIGFNVKTTGTDRLVNSSAAAEKYGKPCVVVSFGTATTIDVVNRQGDYLGGLIAPGVKVVMRALALSTSKLPEVRLQKPEHVIAETTESAIQSGIFYGHIAMVSGLLERIIGGLRDKPIVIAIGGFADLLAPEIKLIDAVDSDLTLEGLNRLGRTA